MTVDEFNIFCGSFPQATSVVQWGGAHVWKISGKVFAIGGWSDRDQMGVTFKCSPETFRRLPGVPGMRPAPYLASRGMTWLQWTGPQSVSLEELREHLWESYRLVGSKLTKAQRLKLGTDADVFE